MINTNQEQQPVYMQCLPEHEMYQRRQAQQAANAELRAAQNALNADLAALADCADRADQLIADELWPEDSELVAEIRATFMREWGMDEHQADARMSRFDYKVALAEMAVVE